VGVIGPVGFVRLCVEHIGSRFVTHEVNARMKEFVVAIVTAPGFPIDQLTEAETTEISRFR
jgi:hypothetical protein